MKNLIKKSALVTLISICTIGAANAKPQNWIGATFTGVVNVPGDGSFLITRNHFTHCRNAVNTFLANNPGSTLVSACLPNL